MNSRPGQKTVGKMVPGFARAAIAAVLAVSISTACTDSTGPNFEVSIVPAAPTVTLQTTPQGQALITSVTLTNTSMHPIAWSSCGMSLEKAGLPALPPANGSWDTVWQFVCYLAEATPADAPTSLLGASLGGPILRPGQSVTIPVSVPVGQFANGSFNGAPGAYRFHFSLSAEILGTFVQVPYDSSVSDPFTLLPAP